MLGLRNLTTSYFKTPTNCQQWNLIAVVFPLVVLTEQITWIRHADGFNVFVLARPRRSLPRVETISSYYQLCLLNQSWKSLVDFSLWINYVDMENEYQPIGLGPWSKPFRVFRNSAWNGIWLTSFLSFSKVTVCCYTKFYFGKKEVNMGCVYLYCVWRSAGGKRQGRRWGFLSNCPARNGNV